MIFIFKNVFQLVKIILITLVQLYLLSAAGFCADTPARRCEAIHGRFTVSSLKPKLAGASTRGVKSKSESLKKSVSSNTGLSHYLHSNAVQG